MILSRRRFTSIAAATAVPVTMRNAGAQTPAATPAASPVDMPNQDTLWLAVADTAAATLSAYALPNMQPVGTIQDVAINSHAGFLPLADGRVLCIDDGRQRLLQIGFDGDRVAILHEAAVPGHVAHIAVNGEMPTICAVGTSAKDTHHLHLVDLTTWTVTSHEITDAEEVGIMLNDEYVFHRNSGTNQIEAYEIAALAEARVDAISTVDIGTFGHGEAIDAAGRTLYVATDDGIDVVSWTGTALSYVQTLAWPEAGGTARGYFCRLTPDGRTLLTYTSDRSAEETSWHEWVNTAVRYDTGSGEITTLDLGNGYTFRFSFGSERLLYAVMGEGGDEAVVLDAATLSEEHRIALPALSTGAKVGDPFYETGQFRATAITPDGSTGFVTQAGDAGIVVLNLVTGAVERTVAHDSVIDGGGVMCVCGTSVPFMDTIGR